MSVLYEDPSPRAVLFDDSVQYDEDVGENVNDRTDEPYWIKAPTPPIEGDTKHWSECSPVPSSDQNVSDNEGVIKGDKAGKTTQLEEWAGTGMRGMAWTCGIVWDVAGVPLMLLVYRLINANWMYFEKVRVKLFYKLGLGLGFVFCYCCCVFKARKL